MKRALVIASLAAVLVPALMPPASAGVVVTCTDHLRVRAGKVVTAYAATPEEEPIEFVVTLRKVGTSERVVLFSESFAESGIGHTIEVPGTGRSVVRGTVTGCSDTTTLIVQRGSARNLF